MYTKYLSSALGTGAVYVEFTILYTDLTAAAATQNIPLFTLPAKGKILAVTTKHNVAFAGTGPWTACTVSVGTSAAVDTFASAFNVFQAVADTTFQDSAQYKSTTESEAGVIARFTATGGNVSAGTAGSVSIRVLYLNITSS